MPLTKLESFRGEEERYRCDLLRTANLAVNEGFEHFLCLGAERVEDRHIDGAGTEDVHANSSLLQLDQPSTREGAHGSFAGAVDTEPRKALAARYGTAEKMAPFR